MKLFTILLFALIAISIRAAEPNPPSWPSSVYVLDPNTPQKSQSIVDQIYSQNGGHNPAFNGQFSDSRFALLFKPGVHNVNVKIGYYTSVIGLGLTANETNIGSVTVENGDFDYTGGALCNFWRSAENFYTKPTQTWNNNPTPTMLWAVSQACPLRNVIIDGDLTLFQYNSGCCAGYSSGGYLSNSIVTGTIYSGSQQQWITRNTRMGSWNGGNWNMVFVGNQGGPGSHCSNNNGGPFTTVDSTPVIAEKPYISIGSNGLYSLVVPGLEFNKVGPFSNRPNARIIDFSNVYVAEESDTADLINQKLASGLHLVLSPGQYKLTSPIVVGLNNTVVLGIGMPTLISVNGNSVISVTAAEGVRVAGILLQAGSVKTDSLLVWGRNDSGNANNPGFLYDCFGRVGGTNDPSVVQLTADTILTIAQGNVVVDNTWFWRADHGVSGEVYNGDNPNNHGLRVFGNDVTIYGLAVEHQLNNLVEWYGNGGRVYFYQSELPYDAKPDFGNLYSSVHIDNSVSQFQGYGFGVYSFFRDNVVYAQNAITSGSSSGIQFTNSLAVFLSGNGGINHIINNQGNSVNANSRVSYLCSYNTLNFNSTDVLEK